VTAFNLSSVSAPEIRFNITISRDVICKQIIIQFCLITSMQMYFWKTDLT